MQLGRLGPNEPAAQRIAGDRVMRARTADFEAAQIVAAEIEAVDDLFLLAFIPQVASAGGDGEAPIAIAGEPVERNEVLTVDVAAHELRVAAEAGDIGPQAHKISGMRIDLAVAMIECDRLADLREQGVTGELANEEAGIRADIENGSADERVAPDLAEIFIEVVAEPAIETDALLVVRLGAEIVGLHQED